MKKLRSYEREKEIALMQYFSSIAWNLNLESKWIQIQQLM